MPPSLWLSAFMATRTYFSVVMRVSVQMMRESAPRTTSWLMVSSPPLPDTIALSVYIGLVPMSPYTTPSVTRTMPAESGMPVLLRVLFVSTETPSVFAAAMPLQLAELGLRWGNGCSPPARINDTDLYYTASVSVGRRAPYGWRCGNADGTRSQGPDDVVRDGIYAAQIFRL